MKNSSAVHGCHFKQTSHFMLKTGDGLVGTLNIKDQMHVMEIGEKIRSFLFNRHTNADNLDFYK